VSSLKKVGQDREGGTPAPGTDGTAGNGNVELQKGGGKTEGLRGQAPR
jgi:hypothetical protein